jgi:hypothetical protein
LCSARWAVTNSSSPSGVVRTAIQTTLTCGLPSGLSVTRVASVPYPNQRARVPVEFHDADTTPERAPGLRERLQGADDTCLHAGLLDTAREPARRRRDRPGD